MLFINLSHYAFKLLVVMSFYNNPTVSGVFHCLTSKGCWDILQSSVTLNVEKHNVYMNRLSDSIRRVIQMVRCFHIYTMFDILKIFRTTSEI